MSLTSKKFEVRQLSQAAVFLTLLATSCIANAGEVYKTVDSQGRVTYSDQPSPNATRIKIDPVHKDASSERDRISKQMQSYAQADAQRSEAATTQQHTQAEKEAAEQRRQQACKQARDRYLTFKEARRPYRRDDQGNRVYYSSAEIDAERAAAEKDMNRICAAQ